MNFRALTNSPRYQESWSSIVQTKPQITVYPNHPLHPAAVLSQRQLEGFLCAALRILLRGVSHTNQQKSITLSLEELKMVPPGRVFSLWSPSHPSAKHNPLEDQPRAGFKSLLLQGRVLLHGRRNPATFLKLSLTETFLFHRMSSPKNPLSENSNTFYYTKKKNHHQKASKLLGA